MTNEKEAAGWYREVCARMGRKTLGQTVRKLNEQRFDTWQKTVQHLHPNWMTESVASDLQPVLQFCLKESLDRFGQSEHAVPVDVPFVVVREASYNEVAPSLTMAGFSDLLDGLKNSVLKSLGTPDDFAVLGRDDWSRTGGEPRYQYDHVAAYQKTTNRKVPHVFRLRGIVKLEMLSEEEQMAFWRERRDISDKRRRF